MALNSLLFVADPPLRYVCKRSVHLAVYGFVDALGVGFGSTFATDKGLEYTYSVRGKDRDHEMSNFRELHNLVLALEGLCARQTGQESEIFIFTDTSTVESSYYKGNTPSKTQFSLIFRLHLLEMREGLTMHVIHISSTRMISRGTDGLSRCNLTDGVMAGTPMISFLPLHLSALERQPSVLDWIHDWLNIPGLWPLSPADWFDKGHGVEGGHMDPRGLWVPVKSRDNWYLWCPPPMAADVAVEELMYSRHKRTQLNHLFIVPRLATQLWRKKLFKVSNLVFEIPPGSCSFWPMSGHEPLLIRLTLCFVSCPPWQLRQSHSILEVGRQLQGVWAAEKGSERALLRELLQLPETLESL